jgi:hypothetical protein
MKKIKHTEEKPDYSKVSDSEKYIINNLIYLRNSLYWLNLYSNRETSKERVIETIDAIETFCAVLRTKVNAQ